MQLPNGSNLFFLFKLRSACSASIAFTKIASQPARHLKLRPDMKPVKKQRFYKYASLPEHKSSLRVQLAILCTCMQPQIII